MLASRDLLLDHYPSITHEHKRHILREYLQHIFLKIIYNGPLASELTFIGGTALRIAYGSHRFSEDIDFDNTGITFEQFEAGMQHLISGLSLRGLEADVKIIQKIAFHAEVKVRNILTEYGLAPDTREEVREKLHIKVDTHNQELSYTTNMLKLDTFGINTFAQVAPISVLMSMKIHTIGQRKRAKGRDYYDLVYLMGTQTTPEYDVLYQLSGLQHSTQVKEYLLDIYASKNADRLHKDVSPFLFNPYDDSIRNFDLYVQQYEHW